MTAAKNMRVAALAAAYAICGQAFAAPTPYSFTSIDAPGALRTQARGINDIGQISGWYEAPGAQFLGYRKTGGLFESLDYPGSTGSLAFGMNGAGQVAGIWDDDEFVTRGFVWDGASYASHEYPGADYTLAIGNNDAGDVVGVAGDASGQFGYAMRGGVFERLAYPAAHGAIVSTTAHDIDNAGRIVGFSEIESNGSTTSVGWLLERGSFSLLAFPGAVKTTPFGLNDAGDVVGSYEDAAGADHGFLYLGGIFWTLDFPGAGTTIASGINASRQVVGLYFDDARKASRGFVAIPVPEPQTWMTLGAGLVLLGLALRQRAQRRQTPGSTAPGGPRETRER